MSVVDMLSSVNKREWSDTLSLFLSSVAQGSPHESHYDQVQSRQKQTATKICEHLNQTTDALGASDNEKDLIQLEFNLEMKRSLLKAVESF